MVRCASGDPGSENLQVGIWLTRVDEPGLFEFAGWRICDPGWVEGSG